MSPRTAPEPPRRLRAADVIDKLLDRRSGGGSQDVELSRNAKGDVQFKVSAVAQEGETLTQARERADAEFKWLCAEYPMQPANGEPDGDKQARRAAAIARRQS